MSASEIRRLAQRLNEERLALLERLQGLDDQKLHYKPKPDDWSPLGIAEHLMKSERGMFQFLPEIESLQPKPFGPKARILLPLATFILNNNISVAPPKGVEPREEMSLSEIHDQWNESQDWLQRFVTTYDTPVLEQPLITHPLIGPLPTLKLLQFVETHFNYHKRQIDGRVGC